MPLTPGQDYTPQQIYQENPEWLKAKYPSLYDAFNKQTQAGQQTQIGGAQAAVDTATINPKIQTITSDAVKAQNDANIIMARKTITDQFNKVKGDDNYVSPQDYNAAKQNNSNLLTDAEFEDHFGKYKNPNNVWYNSPDTNGIRSSLPGLGVLIKAYSELPKSGPEYGFLSKIPGVGGYVQQKQLQSEKAYNDLRNAITGKILQTAGAGEGSTIRGSVTELNRVIDMIPQAYDSKETANEKIDLLDKFLQKSYSSSVDDWLGK